MARTKGADLVKIAGVGAAGLAAWQFIVKPALERFAPAGGATLAPIGAAARSAPIFSAPTIVGPSVNPGGVQGSIVDPRTTPGGDVGQAMWRKTWPEAQARARLDALKAGKANALAQIAKLRAGVANPAAPGVPAAQLQLAQTEAAAANAKAQYDAAFANGDVGQSAIWGGAWATHNQDIAELRARIAAALAPIDVAADIAKWQASIDALEADYAALTGYRLP